MFGGAPRLGRPVLRELPFVVVGLVVGLLISLPNPIQIWPTSRVVKGVLEFIPDRKLLFNFSHVLGSSVIPRLSTRANSDGSHRVPESRRLLYVGVLSAGRFLRTRISACNRTWGQDVARGDMQFFVGTPPQEPYSTHSVVTLDGLSDHEYPPQQKAFRMLRYMCDNYLDKYNWFLRADDDAYFRIAKIRKWLATRDPNVRYYIGQAGYGRDLDKGRLHLPGDDNFCMGGPGVIMSRAAMQGICPHLEACMQDNITRSTGEEDVEIGRCFTKYLGVLCTSAYDFMELFYHSYPQEYSVHPYLYLNDRLTDKVFPKALTLHHVKVSYVMYDLRSYFLAQSRLQWRDTALARRAGLERQTDVHAQPNASQPALPAVQLPDVAELETVVPLTARTVLPLAATSDASTAQLEYESSDWVYCDRAGGVDLAAPDRTLGADECAALLARVTEPTRLAISERKMQFESVVRVFSHSDPSSGERHLVEAAVQKNPGGSVTYQVELAQTLDEPVTKAKSASSPDESEVFVVLPLARVHYQFFQRFMKMYELNFLAGQQADVVAVPPGKTHLYVVLFPDSSASLKEFDKPETAFDPALVVSLYQSKYPHARIRSTTTAGTFSSLAALQLGLKYTDEVSLSSSDSTTQKNGVVMLTTVDLHLSATFVSDCQSRAHLKDVALFPIVSLRRCASADDKSPAGAERKAGAGDSTECSHPDTWLSTSYSHMCSSHGLLSSHVAQVNRSAAPETVYHLLSTAAAAAAAAAAASPKTTGGGGGGGGVQTFRVLDGSLRIEWDTMHGRCAELRKAVSPAMASELFPSCSLPD